MFRLYSVFICLVLGGCASLPSVSSLLPGGEDREPSVIELSYEAADHLHEQLRGTDVPTRPMLAATFVDDRDVQTTSDLGRLLSAQVASRLSQLGYSVSEIQMRTDQLAVRPDGGVFALSRKLEDLSADVPAYAVLIGTYTTIGKRLYVNTRVVRSDDGVALASADFFLPSPPRERHAGSGGAVEASVGTRLQ